MTSAPDNVSPIGHRLIDETGHDAEVAATAAQRPEQVGVLVGGHGAHLAVDGDHLHAAQAVDRQPVQAGEVADAAAERQPGDAHAAGVAERDRQPMGDERGRDLARGEAGAGRDDARVRIDVQAAQRAKIDDQHAIAGRQAGQAVAAAAHRDLEPDLAREAHRAGDVVGVSDLDDGRRAGAVVEVPDAARRLVGVAVRGEDRAGERGGER